MMQLKQFVQATLTEVFEGVLAAQKVAARCGGAINPADLPTRSNKGDVHSRTYRPDQEYLVQFDLAIEAGSEKATEGGVGVFVGAIALGSKGSSGSTQTSTSRVNFTVPIVYPIQPNAD